MNYFSSTLIIHTSSRFMTNTETMIVFIIFFFSFLQSCVCGDMIMRRHSLRDGDVIFSERKRFAFGFFSSPLSKLRYVGIWYAEISEQTVVWVANRDRPVNDKSGLIKFTSRGNLCVYASSVNETEPVWSTNVSDSILEATLVAKLSDIGILVLLDLVTGRCFWESFDHPTDTFLPFMRLGFTRKDGLNRVLTSWRSPGDPGSGIFTYRIKRVGFPQLILYKGLIPWWRAGTWTGQKWSGVPGMTRGYIFNSSFVNNQDEVSITYGVTDASVITRMMVKETGNMQRFTWIARDKRWNGFWSAPKEDCDYYAHCGLNGYCDPTSTEAFECTCLPGFEPKMPRDWLLRDTSGGCTKKNYASICREKEGFVKLRSVKIPDTSNATVDMKITLEECENRCLRNCSCVAYASAYHESDRGATGCLTWHGGILDTRIYVNSGQDFYIRVDREEMVGWNRKGALGKMRAVFILISLIAAVMLLTVVLFCFVRNRRRRVTKRYGDSSEEAVEKVRPRNGRVQERGQVDIKVAASKSREDLRVLRRTG
ncbi:G-type lectin S-receptor-like serine/threonine-protein kinase RKS1 isoform X1 [Brassica napus]|uniref:G-type lectin S-receptor-like serine/threonine-protein kinase RKS1 isoform X1 n=1 Tax=Brassica napus TaxID=3708 RepID=UPI000BBE3BB3|nr:G-type lectin S-receptor-like serine/threonine-protein kinase RKS1 isoform X1 [Brassica napus]